MFGVSPRWLVANFKTLFMDIFKKHNMSVRESYSDMSDEELDQKSEPLRHRYPMQDLEWSKEVSKPWAIVYNGES